MLKLLEICLEEVDATSEEPFIRCVALPGDQPGLALDREGSVRWRPEEPTPYGLCLSGDGQLVLLRASSAGPVTVSRGGRSIEAPADKPVVLLDQDLLRVNGRQLRVHVHGVADQVFPPERVSRSALARAATAAALALSAVVGVGDAAARPQPIEVRDKPPVARPAPREVICEVTAIAPAKQGPLLVYARCPKGSAIPVGVFGQLLNAAGKPVLYGEVTVKRVDGTKVVGETKLPKPVKAPKVRFLID